MEVTPALCYRGWPAPRSSWRCTLHCTGSTISTYTSGVLGCFASTALDQLQDFFGGEMRDGWRFLAMLYTPSLQGVQVGQDCRDLVMASRVMRNV